MKKINISIKIALLATIVLFTSCSKDDDKPTKVSVTSLKTEIEAIRDPFITKLNSLGFNTPNVPSVIIENTPALMSFGGTSLIAPEWETLSNNLKTMFNNWAVSADSGFTGEQFFKKTFNWFLVIHELGHYVQLIKGTEQTNDFYFGEVEANKIAVAYWKVDNREELDTYITMVNAVLAILPVPSDTSAAYFNSNYDSIGSQPEIYGYFQFLFIQQAYLDINNLELSSFL